MEQLIQHNLNELESNELRQCEEVIERGLKTFVEVGNALLTIRDKRLYRQEFGTFEEYCNERWGMSKRNANRLVSASEVIANLGPMGPIPESERQVRPLTKLEPEVYRAAWDQVVEENQDNITAKKVEAVTDQWIEVNEQVKQAKAQPMFVAESPEEIIRKANELKRERSAAKAKERQDRINNLREYAKEYFEDTIEIHFGDFYDESSFIDDNSVDAIITDPPYPIEYLQEWEKMFDVADRILKPSKFLVAYANHQNLDMIFQLNNRLKYYWTFKLDFTLKPMAKGRNLIATWKPVIIWQKLPFKKIEYTIEDCVKETKPFNYKERDAHELNWGQSLGKFEYLIEKFTMPGDLVVEPFAGTGTTMVACKNTNRRCIGFEIMKDQYEEIIKGRIAKGI